MTRKSRHTSAHKWIARVMKLNNYLTEFPMSPGVVPRKMDQEEMLEVLDNGILTGGEFQMDKEGFDSSSGTIRYFIKTCVYYEKCDPTMPETKVAACKSPQREKKSAKQSARHITEECGITMAHCQDHVHHKCKEGKHNGKKSAYKARA
eukprot:1539947-Ditylum_brightwellii.AAC.1